METAKRFALRIPNCNKEDLLERITIFYQSGTQEELIFFTHHEPLEAVFDFTNVALEQRSKLWKEFSEEYHEIRERAEKRLRMLLVGERFKHITPLESDET